MRLPFSTVLKVGARRPQCVALLIAAAFALSAFTPSAFAAPSWGQNEFSTGGSEDIYSAQVLTSVNGTQNGAWRRYSCCNETPVFERILKDGEVGVGPVVLSNTGRQTFSVSEAVTPADTVYYAIDETGVGVRVDIITPLGEIKSLPMLTALPSAAEVSVSVNAQGNAVVVWGYPKLEYAVISPDGTVLENQLLMEEDGRERYVATTAIPGGVFITWTESGEEGYVVKATRISEETNEPGDIFNVSTNPSQEAYEVRVAANAAGDAIASWTTETYSPTWVANVHAAIVPAESTTPRQEVVVEQPGEYYMERAAPYIYPSGAGGVAAEAVNETFPSELIITPIDTAGEPETTYVVPTTEGAGAPSVAVDAHGRAHLTWLEGSTGHLHTVTATMTEKTKPKNAEALTASFSPTSTFTAITDGNEFLIAAYSYATNIVESYTHEIVASDCAAGTYSVTGKEPCTGAEPGYYVESEGATTPTPCASGSYDSSHGSTSSSACLLAPPGTEAVGDGNAEPTACEPGYYAEGYGNDRCSPAEPGHYAVGELLQPLDGGATQQTACPAGSYAEATGAASCTTAPVNTYATGGAIRPTPCPTGTVAPEGAATCKSSGHGSIREPQRVPVLSDVALSHGCISSFVVGLGKPDPQLAISYKLDEPATITFTVLRRYDSPAWRKCPARRGKKSYAYEPEWAATQSAESGAHNVGVGARAARAAQPSRHVIALAAAIADSHPDDVDLRPGTYLLTITAVNKEGGMSAPQTIKFWVTQKG
jgi:hypothetical protein